MKVMSPKDACVWKDIAKRESRLENIIIVLLCQGKDSGGGKELVKKRRISDN